MSAEEASVPTMSLDHPASILTKHFMRATCDIQLSRLHLLEETSCYSCDYINGGTRNSGPCK